MRSATDMLARFNRQLLVDGVNLSDQQALCAWACVAATDGSSVARLAADVACRYLVGGGFGRIAGGSTAAQELDSAVEVGAAVAADPPVAHLYFASRSYGASVDIIATQAKHAWLSGRSANADVATASFDFGRAAADHDAPFVGAAAADLLLSHLLGLSAMPAVARFRVPDAGDPTLDVQPAHSSVAELPLASADGVFSLAHLAGAPAAYAAILADCRAQYPNEACGFIVRKPDGRLCTTVCENLQDRYHENEPDTFQRTARTAFRLDELALVRASEAGDDVVCIYHSHCDAGAYFSHEDVARALHDGAPLYPEVAYLVVSVFSGEPRGAAMYRFDPDAGTYIGESELAARAQARASEELAATRASYAAAVRGGGGSFAWQVGTSAVTFDAAWKAQLGYTESELRDDVDSWFRRLHVDDAAYVRAALNKLAGGDIPLLRLEYRVQHRDGAYRWMRCTAGLDATRGAQGALLGTQEDISAAKLAEQSLTYAEQHDPLTGLLNVEPFVVRLDEQLIRPDDAVLVVCDIEGFREINERYDRLTGDDALVSVAGLLEDHLGKAAPLARLSADDFAFVVAGDLDAAVAQVQGLLQTLRAEVFVARNGEQYGLSVSFALGAADERTGTGRAWLDTVFCALRGDLPPTVVRVPAGPLAPIAGDAGAPPTGALAFLDTIKLDRSSLTRLDRVTAPTDDEG